MTDQNGRSPFSGGFWVSAIREIFNDSRRLASFVVVAFLAFPFIATGFMAAVHIGAVDSVATENHKLLVVNNTIMTSVQRQGEFQVRLALADCVNRTHGVAMKDHEAKRAIELCLSSLEETPTKMIKLIRERID